MYWKNFQETKKHITPLIILNKEDALHCPNKFLNTLSVLGLPAHTLKLKLGVSIMLMKNL